MKENKEKFKQFVIEQLKDYYEWREASTERYAEIITDEAVKLFCQPAVSEKPILDEEPNYIAPPKDVKINYYQNRDYETMNKHHKGNDFIADVVQRYSLLQLQSNFTGEMFETWYRPDMMLFVERWVLEEGKVVDKFRILPNTNNVSKIGHIDFTKHYYNNFEDAVKVLVSLNVS